MPILNFNQEEINQKDFAYCIIGAGVVGLSMGVRLAEKFPDRKVVILESGGESPSYVQKANDGEIIGNKAYSLIASRARAIAGTQWFWGGNSRPLAPIDFTHRSWISKSGWPIEYSDFSQYILAATKELDINNLNWENQHPALDHINLNNDPVFEHTHFKLSPQIVHTSKLATGNYYQSRKTKIKSLKNLYIITFATVVNLNTHDNKSSIKNLVIQNTEDKKQKINSDVFIFAAGGIENARLLKYFCELDHGLNLPGKENIGKYFMEHPHLSLNSIVIPQHSHKKYNDYAGRLVDNAVHQARFRLKDSFQKNYKLNNTTMVFMKNKHSPFDEHFDDNQIYSAVLLMEQEPNQNNRIEFTNEKDMFGIPKINLHWSLSEQDNNTLKQIPDIINQFMIRQNIGRTRGKNFRDNSLVGGGHHHMGTCRMGNTPIDAVVDKNCKIFGLDNAYVSGGAVFSTSGAVNPTINMLALGLRLVDHLT